MAGWTHASWCCTNHQIHCQIRIPSWQPFSLLIRRNTKAVFLSALSHGLQKSLSSFPPCGHNPSKNILTANVLMLLAKVSLCGLMCQALTVSGLLHQAAEWWCLRRAIWVLPCVSSFLPTTPVRAWGIPTLLMQAGERRDKHRNKWYQRFTWTDRAHGQKLGNKLCYEWRQQIL